MQHVLDFRVAIFCSSGIKNKPRLTNTSSAPSFFMRVNFMEKIHQIKELQSVSQKVNVGAKAKKLAKIEQNRKQWQQIKKLNYRKIFRHWKGCKMHWRLSPAQPHRTTWSIQRMWQERHSKFTVQEKKRENKIKSDWEWAKERERERARALKSGTVKRANE